MDESGNRLVDYVVFLVRPARALRSGLELNEHEQNILSYLERVQRHRKRPIRRYSRPALTDQQFYEPLTMGSSDVS